MRRLPIAICLTLLCLLSANRLQAEVVDRIVAIVNDEVITLSELNEEGAPYFQTLIQRAPADRLQGEMAKLRQEVLNHLIDQRLIEQQATKLEIRISDTEIEQTIDAMLAENRATREKLSKELSVKGISEVQYKRQMKNQMLQQRLINHEVRSKVVVTEEMINAYYAENYTGQAASTAAGYHILQMGFLWGEGTKRQSAGEARQAAEYAMQQLQAGQSFSEVASALSDLPSKEDGGDIGVFDKDEMAPYMKDVILGLNPGETSQILQTPAGYQILKLMAIKDGTGSGGAPPLVEVRKEIEAKIYQREGEQLFKKWITDLRGKAFIKQDL